MSRADMVLAGIINNMPCTNADIENAIIVILFLVVTAFLVFTPSHPRNRYSDYYYDYPPMPRNYWNRRPPRMW